MRRSLPIFFALAAACQDDTIGNEATRSQSPTNVPSGAHAEEARPEPSAPEAGPDAEAPVPYVPFDVNHVLSTGQSNSVANDGVPVLSKTQPYANVMFDTGVMTSSSCDGDGCRVYDEPSSFVPLVEGDTFFYPVETMSSGLANEVASLTGGEHAMLVSLHGRSGNSYGCLRKGGCGWWPDRGYVVPFEDGMRQVQDAKKIAEKNGKTYVVRAVTAIHGEHDHYAYTSGDSAFPMPGTDGVSTVRDYSDALLEWQRDYEDGVRTITGQKLPVPLFINQYSHWNDVPTTKIAYMQLDAHLRSNGKVVVVGPTYALGYTSRCLHFTNHGERQLGEYFAKAYRRVVIEGRRWEPLRPISVTIDGNVVTAKFLVPSPPLVFDHERVDDPGNEGFEWYDDSGAPPSITNVAITGPDTVRVTLSAPPAGGDRRLRYAYTFRGCTGTRSLARGTLRDSDATPSAGGYDLYNWAVHFDVPLP
jgi:hypothetical protein